jgi:hypothetical protein
MNDIKELLKTFECCPKCKAKIQSTCFDYKQAWYDYTACTKCDWDRPATRVGSITQQNPMFQELKKD